MRISYFISLNLAFSNTEIGKKIINNNNLPLHNFVRVSWVKYIKHIVPFLVCGKKLNKC